MSTMSKLDTNKPRKVPALTTGGSTPGEHAILMSPDEVIPLKRAAEYAQRNDSTMKRWVKKYGIGRQAGSHGRIEVSILGLSMVLHEDWLALAALKAGDRSHPLVRRHIDHLGLPG